LISIFSSISPSPYLLSSSINQSNHPKITITVSISFPSDSGSFSPYSQSLYYVLNIHVLLLPLLSNIFVQLYNSFFSTSSWFYLIIFVYLIHFSRTSMEQFSHNILLVSILGLIPYQWICCNFEIPSSISYQIVLSYSHSQQSNSLFIEILVLPLGVHCVHPWI